MSPDRAAELNDRLLPLPRRLEPRSPGLTLRRRPRVVIEAGGEPGRRLTAALERALDTTPLPAAGASSQTTVRCLLDPEPARRESYRLNVGPTGVEITAGGEAGLFWGIQTFAQCLAGAADGSPVELPGVAIEDEPALAERGVLLDVSRNKVPTMATLFEIVDRLSSWKINRLQLYFEHTFAYPGHEAVWRHASPLTAAEVRELDRYCAERQIQLVPNQNSFGHFHRWLVHPRYRSLAERPDGVEHPFSDGPEPFSLCPTDPRALDLLAELYDELLPNFRGDRFNVGLDETLELGTGRSAEVAARHGVGRVYLDFLRRVRRLAAEHGRQIEFWADVILAHPELIPKLPGDVMPLIWGYEANDRFEERCRPFADTGLAFTICPGTSSWLSFSGRWRNALANLAAATDEARRLGAAGVLITDWGDLGHLQPLAVSWLGLLAGADLAWRGGAEPVERPWPELLDRYALHRAGLGSIARALGETHREAGAPIRNGTVLGRLVLSHRDRLDHERYEKLTREGLAAVSERVAETRADLALLSGGDHDARGRLAAAELDWVARVLGFAARLGDARLAAGRSREIEELPAAERRALAKLLAPLIEELPPLWRARNRLGGLAESRARLESVAQRLESRV